MVFPDSMRGEIALRDPRLGASGQVSGPNAPQNAQHVSTLFGDSINMLLGGSSSGGRQESRMANWSDDGLPPPAAPANASSIVAGVPIPSCTKPSKLDWA